MTSRTWSASAPLPLAVLAYVALAAMTSPASFAAIAWAYLVQAATISVLLLIGIPLAALVFSPRAPARFIRDLLARRGLRLVLVTMVFCLGLAGFTTFKIAIPNIVPFYADGFLADLDAWLHGGDPGLYVHAVVPVWAQYPLAYLYGMVWFLVWFGLMAFVALHDDECLRQRYFWSMALTICLLGTVAATAFSSVGPIFYANFLEPDRFAPLIAAIEASAVGDYMQLASGYLLTGYQTGQGGSGAGISAMPSMHLAIVTLNACMLRGINRWAGMLAWLYVGLILLGSVYLGWHYAVDGYASIAAVALIWWGVGQTQRQARSFGLAVARPAVPARQAAP